MKKQLKIFLILLIIFGIIKLPYYFLPYLIRTQLSKIENFSIDKIDNLVVSPFLTISSSNLSSRINVPPFSIPLDLNETLIQVSPIYLLMLELATDLKTNLYGGDLNGQINYSMISHKLISGNLKAVSINSSMNKFLNSLGFSGKLDLTYAFKFMGPNSNYSLNAIIETTGLNFVPNFLLQTRLPTIENVTGKIEIVGETDWQVFHPTNIKLDLNYLAGSFFEEPKLISINFKLKDDFKKLIPNLLKLDPMIAMFKEQILKLYDKLGDVKLTLAENKELNVESQLFKITGNYDAILNSGQFRITLSELCRNELKDLIGTTDSFYLKYEHGRIDSAMPL